MYLKPTIVILGHDQDIQSGASSQAKHGGAYFSAVLTLPDYRILYSMENQPCNPTSIRKCFRHVFAYTVISHIARYQTKHLSDSQ